MSQQAADSLMSIFGIKRARCEDCKQAIQSVAYPKLYCLFNAEYVANDDQCARWVKK